MNLKNQKVILGLMVFLALMLPIISFLGQQNQENRSHAAGLNNSCEVPSGCGWDNCKGSCTGSSDIVCYGSGVSRSCKIKSGGNCTKSSDCYGNHYCSRTNNHCRKIDKKWIDDYSVEGRSVRSMLGYPNPTIRPTTRPTVKPTTKPTVRPTIKPTLYYYRESTNICIQSQFYPSLDSCKKAQKNKCYILKSDCEKNMASTSITGITLSPSPLNLRVGESGKITVNTIPAGISAQYVWSKNQSGAIKLYDGGKVDALKEGKAVVVVKVKDKTSIFKTVEVIVSKGTDSVNCTDYDYSNWGECVNGTQTRTVKGNLPKGCTGTPTKQKILSQDCDGSTTSDASISFKVAFAGIGEGSSACIGEYFIPETRLNLEVNNVPTNKFDNEIQTTFEVIAGEFNTKGNQVFKVTQALDKNKFGSVNNFNYVKVKGPWHLKRRMCQDNQNGKLSETTVCDIDLKASSDKVYDFSEYALLSGDAFDPPDGVVNSQDLGYVKTRMFAGAEVECGREADLNLDGVVNNGDLGLVRLTLQERDDE